jgi:hypothetical protein
MPALTSRGSALHLTKCFVATCHHDGFAHSASPANRRRIKVKSPLVGGTSGAISGVRAGERRYFVAEVDGVK